MAAKTWNSLSEDQWNLIRLAPDYRLFLREYLKIRGLNLSDIARQAGFHRSYPSDVLSGKRRLTFQSCIAFEKCLKLPSHGRKLFRLLVAKEESELFPDLEPQKIEDLINKLRSKSAHTSRKQLAENTEIYAKDLLKDSRARLIYAAAGGPENGVQIETLQARTGLTEKEIESTLKKLMAFGLIKKTGTIYAANELHLFVKSKDRSQLLVDVFQDCCSLASERIKTVKSLEEELFFTSQFCIKKEKLSELKEALRTTILNFVDDSIDLDGDKVISLVTALHL